MSDYDELIRLIVFFVVGVITLACFFLQPKFEADAYTRLTGKKITYLDAMWLDLRIQETVKDPVEDER